MVHCQGITKDGKKCKNQATEGKKYCHLHSSRKSAKPVKVVLVKPKAKAAKSKKLVKKASPDVFEKYYSESVLPKRSASKAPAKKVAKKVSPKTAPKTSPKNAKIANEKCSKLFEVYGQKEAERILDQNIEMGQMMKGVYKASPLVIKPRAVIKKPLPKKPLPARPVKKVVKKSPKKSLLGYFDEEIFIPEQFSN
jgi:hypothetical protein